MNAKLLIDDDIIGIINLEILDEFMGVLSGELIPTEIYKNYQNEIHKHFEQKGISNIIDFNYRIRLENGYELRPEGGIGIIHSREFSEEIIVETAGNNIEELKNFC
ncbi:hypothetical protein [Soonwooa purpurea]